MYATITPPAAFSRPSWALRCLPGETMSWADGIGCEAATIPCVIPVSERPYLKMSTVHIADWGWWGLVWEVGDSEIQCLGFGGWTSLMPAAASYTGTFQTVFTDALQDAYFPLSLNTAWMSWPAGTATITPGSSSKVTDALSAAAAACGLSFGFYEEQAGGSPNPEPHLYPYSTTPDFMLDCSRIDQSGLVTDNMEPAASVARVPYGSTYVDETDTDPTHYLVQAGITKSEVVSPSGNTTVDATSAAAIGTNYVAAKGRDIGSGTVVAPRLTTIDGAYVLMPPRPGQMVRLLNVRGRSQLDCAITRVHVSGGIIELELDTNANRLAAALSSAASGSSPAMQPDLSPYVLQSALDTQLTAASLNSHLSTTLAGYATTGALAAYMPLAGGTFSGDIHMGGHAIELASGEYAISGYAVSQAGYQTAANVASIVTGYGYTTVGAVETALGYASHPFTDYALTSSLPSLSGYAPLASPSFTGNVSVLGFLSATILSEGDITAYGAITAQGHSGVAGEVILHSSDGAHVGSLLADNSGNVDWKVGTSSYSLATQSYVTGLGYQTAANVTSAITGYGYTTGAGYQTTAGLDSAVGGLGYIKSVSGYAPINSPTFTGTVTLPDGYSAASQNYAMAKAGGTFTGNITLPDGYLAASQNYVTTQGYAPLTGGTFSGAVYFQSHIEVPTGSAAVPSVYFPNTAGFYSASGPLGNGAPYWGDDNATGYLIPFGSAHATISTIGNTASGTQIATAVNALIATVHGFQMS